MTASISVTFLKLRVDTPSNTSRKVSSTVHSFSPVVYAFSVLPPGSLNGHEFCISAFLAVLSRDAQIKRCNPPDKVFLEGPQ